MEKKTTLLQRGFFVWLNLQLRFVLFLLYRSALLCSALLLTMALLYSIRFLLYVQFCFFLSALGLALGSSTGSNELLPFLALLWTFGPK